jgi:hypothetical protein
MNSSAGSAARKSGRFARAGPVSIACSAVAPFTDCALLVLAGVASVAALPLILTLPHARAIARTRAQKLVGRPFWMATAPTATSWCVMAHVMGGAPHTLVDCGVGRAILSGMSLGISSQMYVSLAFGTYSSTRSELQQ